MGEDRTGGNSAGASGWVTTQVAADALGVDPRTVRTYIRRGLLDAKVEGEGVEKAYSVDIDSLYALPESRKPPRKGPRKIREKSAGKPRLGETSEDLAELVRDLTEQAIRSSSEAADLRARLQLTERAQSTLEEEARELREERDRLRAELEAERSKGFWARLFWPRSLAPSHEASLCPEMSGNRFLFFVVTVFGYYAWSTIVPSTKTWQGWSYRDGGACYRVLPSPL